MAGGGGSAAAAVVRHAPAVSSAELRPATDASSAAASAPPPSASHTHASSAPAAPPPSPLSGVLPWPAALSGAAGLPEGAEPEVVAALKAGETLVAGVGALGCCSRCKIGRAHV